MRYALNIHSSAKLFLFKIIVDSEEAAKIEQRGLMSPPTSFYSGDILHNYNIREKSGN